MSDVEQNVLDRFVLMQKMPIPKKYVAATKEEAEFLYATENVVTFREDLVVKIPAESRRKQYIGLVEAIKTESTLRGKIATIFVDNATHMINATILYGDFRVIIPLPHLLRIPKKDIAKFRVLDNMEQLNFLKMLGRMRIGSVVDFIPRQIDENGGFVIASRLMAMEKEMLLNFFPNKKNATPKVTNGSYVQARVCYTKKLSMGIEIGGVETTMRLRDISHQRLTSVQDVYKPGDYILVKVLEVKYKKNRMGKVTNVNLATSAKAAVKNPQIDNYYNYALYESVPGKVKQRTVHGLFVRLDDSECDVMCYPEKDLVEAQKADVGDKVLVKIVKKNEEERLLWGIVQWNYSKNKL